MERIIAQLQEKYPMTALDLGELETVKKGSMRFTVRAYEAEGLGHISVMERRAFLMRGEMLIINPFCVDAPLFVYDRTQAAGTDLLLCALYETRLYQELPDDRFGDVLAQYGDLFDALGGEHWYDSLCVAEPICKKMPKKCSARMDALAWDYAKAYLRLLDEVQPCDRDRKRLAARTYTDGVLQNIGPSVEFYARVKGAEKARKMVCDYLFGTGLPKEQSE